MLLGRQREQARIDWLLDQASSGASGVLVIRGDPGIGKTALLDYARRGAGDMPVLGTQGVQTESELVFAALAELLAPLVALISTIPPPQASALRGALALGTPAPGDPFTIFAATLSLLAAAAEENGLLVLVDDAHWLDRPSRAALAFVARRLEAEGIAFIAAERTSEDSGFGQLGLPVLELAGLPPGAARRLLAHGGRRPADAVADQLVAACAGNPLALLELPGLLTDSQLAGAEKLAAPLPVGPSIERALRHRLDRLPGGSRAALLLAACSETGALSEIAPAITQFGGAGVLEPAEAAGFIKLDSNHLTFHHPLMRSAAYHGAAPAERRAAHRTLARVLTGQANAERRAWHLAAAAAGPDEEIAAGLEEAGQVARARGGYSAAATALARAAKLTIDPEHRARRLLEAGRCAGIVGETELATVALEEAIALTTDARLSAEIHLERGRVFMWSGSTKQAYELLLAESGRFEETDPAFAAAMLCDAVGALCMCGEFRRARRVAERAFELAATGSGPLVLLAELNRAVTGIVFGEARQQRTDALRLNEAIAVIADPMLLARHVSLGGSQALMWIEEYDAAAATLRRLISLCRTIGAVGLLSFPLSVSSELDFRLGRWISARAAAEEGLRLGIETGQFAGASFGAVCVARVAAGLGLETVCREHIDHALQTAERYGLETIVPYACAAAGLLELGTGQVAGALDELERLALLVERTEIEDPACLQWAPDLIEAYVRAGRVDDARRTLERFEGQAERTGNTWAHATAARCRGLMADDEAFDGEFERARTWHERTPTPFERARTELCYGERLRRGRRRTEARDHLRSALATFEQVGANPWAERARSELAATGERVRKRDPTAAEQLTPQELQVALIVAEGATNREAATQLFLSPKTIEFHLAHVYRKLGIRSRTELARRLTWPPPVATEVEASATPTKN